MTRPRGLVVALATLGGVVSGWLLAERYLGFHRSDLFSPRRRRRHAAIGFLAGQPSPGTLRLLRDYLAWERHPALLRRGRRVAREIEAALG